MRKIRQISVTNLFGMFTHVIPLNLEDHITIIHGPNGFGKTIILKLLSEIFSQADLQLFSRTYEVLRTIPFDEFRIDFEDGYSFWVKKDNRAEIGRLIPRITFYDSDHATWAEAFTLYLNLASTVTPGISMLSMINSTIPELDYIGSNWRFPPTGEELTFENVLERFADRLSFIWPRKEEPDWLKAARRSAIIHLIETQRLSGGIKISAEDAAAQPTVIQYTQELVGIIKTQLAASVALSQSLDSTFPARIVRPNASYQSISKQELRDRLISVGKKRARLVTAGLLDREDNTAFQPGDPIDESTKVALSIYVEDTEKKLGVFDELADKLDLLTDIINRRFLYKRMSINKERGFVFTTSGGTNLLLTNLSSGEQHELVMLYELLFKTVPGSLILIDEPEISLHIVWQEQFIKDVQRITGLTDIDVLVATHSPDIISDRWDLTVQLEGPGK